MKTYIMELSEIESSLWHDIGPEAEEFRSQIKETAQAVADKGRTTVIVHAASRAIVHAIDPKDGPYLVSQSPEYKALIDEYRAWFEYFYKRGGSAKEETS